MVKGQEGERGTEPKRQSERRDSNKRTKSWSDEAHSAHCRDRRAVWCRESSKRGKRQALNNGNRCWCCLKTKNGHWPRLCCTLVHLAESCVGSRLAAQARCAWLCAWEARTSMVCLWSGCGTFFSAVETIIALLGVTVALVEQKDEFVTDRETRP